jgi:HD superfamily phosphohydrolase YqeK
VSGTGVTLPPWAQVSDKRREHIARVVALLDEWSAALRLPADEATRWRTAGLLHDALRDAPESTLRALSGNGERAAELLHGPAAAMRAAQDGERRDDVLDAIRFHTVGCRGWSRTGRALYMADFLEPGRKFLIAERQFLARQVPHDFDATFRATVRLRLEWSLSQGGELFAESVELWNAVR